jgi:hypothetical protein
LCTIVIGENGSEHLGSVKGRVFLDELRDFSAPEGGLCPVDLKYLYVSTN